MFVRPIEQFVRLLDPLWALAAQTALDVVVIGGGAAGFELAMAFAWRLRSVGVLTDSDDLRTRAEAWYGDLVLQGEVSALKQT